MNKEAVIRTINASAPALRAAGVGHIYLFGSAARDTLGPNSDVDVIIDPSKERFSLIDIFRVQDTLSEVLARKVDVIDKRGLPHAPEFTARIAGDAGQVF